MRTWRYASRFELYYQLLLSAFTWWLSVTYAEHGSYSMYIHAANISQLLHHNFIILVIFSMSGTNVPILCITKYSWLEIYMYIPVLSQLTVRNITFYLKLLTYFVSFILFIVIIFSALLMATLGLPPPRWTPVASSCF